MYLGTFPLSTKKASVIVPVVNSKLVSKVLKVDYIPTFYDISTDKEAKGSLYQEIKYWNLDIEEKRYSDFFRISTEILDQLKEKYFFKEEIILTCECGKLELLQSELDNKRQSERKLLDQNGCCDICKTSKTENIQSLYLKLDVKPDILNNISIIPPNLNNSLLSASTSLHKEIRVSRNRNTLIYYKFENQDFNIDVDFFSHMILLYQHLRGLAYVSTSQRYLQKIALLNSFPVLASPINAVLYTYQENFMEHYNKLREVSNKENDLILLIASNTTWKKNISYCDPSNLKKILKMSDDQKDNLVNKIKSAENINKFLYLFSNNILNQK